MRVFETIYVVLVGLLCGILTWYNDRVRCEGEKYE